MKNVEYYLAQYRRIAEHRVAGSERIIRKIYKNFLKNMRYFMADKYANAAENGTLTYAVLQRYGGYARFIEEVETWINSSTPAISEEVKRIVNDTYELCYQGMITAVQNSTTISELMQELEGLKNTTPEIIKRAVENPVHGLTLSDTLEKNRQGIIYDIKRVIGVGIANGDRFTTMAKRISESIDNDYKKSIRIVRTETHRVQEAGFHDSAKDINDTLKTGVTHMRMHKKWCSMRDERVRVTSKANHRKMDGVSIPVDDKFDLGRGIKADSPGNSGDAANDINCRCFLKYELKEAKGLPEKQ